MDSQDGRDHTYAEEVREERAAHATTKMKLMAALERNIDTCHLLHDIKSSGWYRLGKLLRLCP